MIEPASNAYKIKIQQLWTATKRDAFLLALKQCYAENFTLAECAELIRAATHDGLTDGLRVVNMLPTVAVAPSAKGQNTSPSPQAIHENQDPAQSRRTSSS